MNISKQKNRRLKLLVAIIITVVVVIGLNSRLFVSWGILDFNADKPVIELDVLARVGVNTDALEKDINRMVANVSNAQQGNHFIFGIISGLIFSQPTAGLTVGLIKESLDFVNNYRDNRINGGYFIDAFVDTIFWALGGFVGFYLLSVIYDMFRQNSIKSPKDLVVFLGRKFSRRKTNS